MINDGRVKSLQACDEGNGGGKGVIKMPLNARDCTLEVTVKYKAMLGIVNIGHGFDGNFFWEMAHPHFRVKMKNSKTQSATATIENQFQYDPENPKQYFHDVDGVISTGEFKVDSSMVSQGELPFEFFCEHAEIYYDTNSHKTGRVILNNYFPWAHAILRCKEK